MGKCDPTKAGMRQISNKEHRPDKTGMKQMSNIEVNAEGWLSGRHEIENKK
jgi:hypothetical protein